MYESGHVRSRAGRRQPSSSSTLRICRFHMCSQFAPAWPLILATTWLPITPSSAQITGLSSRSSDNMLQCSMGATFLLSGYERRMHHAKTRATRVDVTCSCHMTGFLTVVETRVTCSTSEPVPLTDAPTVPLLGTPSFCIATLDMLFLELTAGSNCSSSIFGSSDLRPSLLSSIFLELRTPPAFRQLYRGLSSSENILQC